MEQFTNSINKSLDTENWFAALYMALTIPDICGGLSQPDIKGHKQRFINWFEKYIAHKYVHISSEAFWQLRCSVLHGGTHIDEKLQAELSNSELLVVSYIESPFHDCYIKWDHDSSYTFLRIDVFCNHICEAIKEWSSEIANNNDIQSKVDKLFHIEKGAKAKEMIIGNVNLKWGQYSIQGMFTDIPAKKGFKPLWENRPQINNNDT